MSRSEDFFRKREHFFAGAISLLVLIYFLYWFFRLYPTLINDEYSALEYVYRIVKSGEVYPTPHRFHKPYSLILGFLAFTRGPFAYQLVAILSSALVVFAFFLLARTRLRLFWALLASLMVGFASDQFSNTLRAITMIPAGFFFLLALYFGFKVADSQRGWKKYCLFGFLGGLARPELWLLAFPLFFWLFPRKKKDIFRWLVAGGIFVFSVLLWFGKDLYFNHNFFHSFEVARYDKIIGTGAYFGALKSLYFFKLFLSRKFSLPILLISILGFFAYAYEQRKRIWKNPLIVLTVLLFLFFYFSTLSGVYPQMRFYYLLGLCLTFYPVYLFQKLWEISRNKLIQRGVLFLSLIFFGGYFFWSARQIYRLEYPFLKRESELQRQTIKLAEFFKDKLRGKSHRILISDRRDDQLSWLLRDFPLQDYIHFRETHYCERFYGQEYVYLLRADEKFRRQLYEICDQRKDFLDFNPEWIVWVSRDFQYRGVQEMYQWLSFQDRTVLRGHLIELVAEIGEYRIFQVRALNQ